MTSRPHDWEEPVSIPEVDTAFDRVLVPFDGSHAAERALAYAISLARVSGGEILVAVAYDPPVTVRRRGGLVLEGLRGEMEEEASDLATESVALLTEQGLTARGIVVRGNIVDAILETADLENADIIILGRHGLSHETRAEGTWHHMGHGSVTDKVARHATIPVLVVS